MFRFVPAIRALALAMLVALATVAHAQQQAPLVGIDPIRASLDQIDAGVRRATNARTLNELIQSLGPLRDSLRDKRADLEPRLADLDARLKSLGAAPAPNAPAEDPALAAERTRVTQQRAELDGAIKQVQLLQTRADQLATLLSDRRRTIYSQTLFQRSPNVLDPYFWVDVAAALPDAAQRLVSSAQSAANYAREKGGMARLGSAGLALLGFLAFVIGLARWWRRVGLIGRVGARYGKALAALLLFARLALATPLTVLVVVVVLDQFELVSPDH